MTTNKTEGRVFAVDNVLNVVQGKIRKLMNERADFLVDPGVQSFDEYKYQRGLLMGLAEAEREILDLDLSMNPQEDE